MPILKAVRNQQDKHDKCKCIVKYSQLSRTFLFQSMVFIHSFTWFSSEAAVAASGSSGAASEDMVGVSLRRKDRVGLLAPRTR